MPHGSERRRRVLLAEDSDVLLGLSSRLLDREGYDVVAVDEGSAAIGAARHEIDVLILDVGLPGMNGLEVCRRLRADPATESLPIILLTGRSDPRDVRDGLIAGADAFLVKPVEIDGLLAAVRWLSDGRPDVRSEPAVATSQR